MFDDILIVNLPFNLRRSDAGQFDNAMGIGNFAL